MGGLKKFMPITAMTFIVGWLAIAGVFPFAGFWSKDEILAAAWVSETVNGHQVLWGIGVLTAFLTAFYMTRQVRLVFFGEERWQGRLHHEPHESPKVMTMPLVVLAVLSVVGGALEPAEARPRVPGRMAARRRAGGARRAGELRRGARAGDAGLAPRRRRHRSWPRRSTGGG